MRLDAVDVLIAGTIATTDLSDILVKFPDLDKTLSGLATAGHSSRAESVTINKANGTCTSSSTNPRAVKLAIDTLIYVKHSIQQGRQLADTLHRIIAQCNASSSDASACTRNPYAADMNGASLSVDREAESSAKAALLNCIERNLRDPSLSTILDAIVALLTEGAAYSRASHEMRHQECFAVRAGVHTFLDVSRSAFLQTVGEIHDKASLYAEELNTEVRVAFSSSRGYFLQIHLSSDRDASTILPRMFIQAVQNRRVVSCTTNELLSLSSRALEAIETALRITSDLVQDLLAWIRGYSDVLFVFVDSIALLDMLQSFAELVHSCPHVMARPRLTQGGALVIKEGRHPIMSLLGNRHGCSRTAGNIVRDGLPFVPNDTYISDTEAFQIVTGGNGAGKSTYIKQVALLCILAQVGCYVPAAYMLLPVRTRLHSRIGTGDDMEHNMSTFHTEMRECGYILDMTNRSCLVIIDELGRGTANAEGLSIAMAVAEALVASGAMTLFVTHFAQLTALEDVYPAAVCNVHLGSSPRIEMSDGGRSGQAIEGDIGGASERELNDEGDAGSHKMCTGPSPLRSGYGLMAAQRCGIPAEVMGVASALHRRLKQLHPLMLDVNVEQRSVAALQSLLGSMSVLRSSTLDYAGIRFYLSTLAKKLNDSEREGLLHTLDTLTKPHRCKASVSSSDGISVIVSEQSCSRSAAPEIETRPEALCTDDKENVESLTAHQPRYIAGIDTKGQRFSLTELDSSTDLSTTALDSTDEKAYKRARISVAYTPNITIT
jgi:DNA mismatch repair ATPase MutS